MYAESRMLTTITLDGALMEYLIPGGFGVNRTTNTPDRGPRGRPGHAAGRVSVRI